MRLFRIWQNRLSRLLLATTLAALLVWYGVRRITFSVTDSVGSRLFWRTECPGDLARWQLVEVVPDPADPFVPHPKKVHLAKKVGCLEGETLVREGLDYWCRTREGFFVFLGKAKLAARDGRPLKPFTYDAGEQGEAEIAAGYVFVTGDLEPHSYDSRYFGPVARERIQACLVPLL